MRYRHHTYQQASVWIGAGVVGILAVLYARLIGEAQGWYFSIFHAHALIVSLCTPLFFVGATALVGKIAPEAKGSGIPQVLAAISLAEDEQTAEVAWRTDLVSVKTAVVKIFSSLVGVLGGASIGREGPTVQVAASGFALVARITKRWVPKIDIRSYLTAGAAAGVAAAFNTPLAGITFALEEIAEESFGHFRQTVMLAVIIAGVTAQALLGDYLYFGHPTVAGVTLGLFPEALFIGIVAGVFGGAFARLLAFPQLTRLPKNWWPRALVCGVLCAAIGYFTAGDTAGSGYEVTRRVLEDATPERADALFPIWKLATTVLSYLSGMAGGIFSPSLSIGAGVGVSIAHFAHLANFKACAMLGMVAFFAAAVQAPLTAVIIVMEMTDEHKLIMPFMVAAFIGHGLGRLFMPMPLYRYLATRGADA